MTEPAIKPYSPPDDEAVHGFFGLSYCTHLVLPRVLLQSMPGWWQAQFVALMEQYDEAVRDTEQPRHYDVTAAEQHEASDLTEAQMKLAGITREWTGEEAEGYGQYYDKDGDEIESWTRVLVPCADPLPSYNRGRTILPLRPITEPADGATGAEVERLTTELAKYVGWEPTAQQEYEHACGQLEKVAEAVRAFRDDQLGHLDRPGSEEAVIAFVNGLRAALEMP